MAVLGTCQMSSLVLDHVGIGHVGRQKPCLFFFACATTKNVSFGSEKSRKFGDDFDSGSGRQMAKNERTVGWFEPCQPNIWDRKPVTYGARFAIMLVNII